MLWVLTTLAAAAGQTARNAMQSSLTAKLGTLGATQVRFVYGFPFSVLFLAAVVAFSGEAVPAPGARFLIFTASGAIAQILGTVCLLAAMRDRSFSVATAFTKTEAVQVALFGLVILGDELSWMRAVAIVVATAGVLLIAFKPGEKLTRASLRPALYGIASGGLYAIAAVGFRGGILALDSGAYFVRASTTLVWSLAIQSVLLGGWMLAFQRASFFLSFSVWRQSLFAGLMGAFASQCWFLGFSLTSAANVRTLGLVEVLFAQAVSRRVFSQSTTWRELAGMTLVLVGVGLLLASAI
ncbi:MAG: DMT family transporter [Micropepsaceae bacterium]